MLSVWTDVTMYVCNDVGFSSTSKGKPLLSNESTMTDFRHYYVLRILHVYKCTVNENTNKSAYWYTSQKSTRFCKTWYSSWDMPLRICPFFISAHWLAHVSLDSSIISNREHVGVATTFLPNYENWVVNFTCYGWNSSVVWLQSASCSKSSFWVVPFIFLWFTV